MTTDTLRINSDLLLDNDYWQYCVDVTMDKDGMVVYADLVWARGAGPDDEALTLDQGMEQIILESAIDKAFDRTGDLCFKPDYSPSEEVM